MFSEYEIQRFKKISENKKKFDEILKSKTQSLKASLSIKEKNLKPKNSKAMVRNENMNKHYCDEIN